jgi:hypothetical protein
LAAQAAFLCSIWLLSLVIATLAAFIRFWQPGRVAERDIGRRVDLFAEPDRATHSRRLAFHSRRLASLQPNRGCRVLRRASRSAGLQFNGVPRLAEISGTKIQRREDF